MSQPLIWSDDIEQLLQVTENGGCHSTYRHRVRSSDATEHRE
jgi:hypothetical protein